MSSEAQKIYNVGELRGEEYKFIIGGRNFYINFPVGCSEGGKKDASIAAINRTLVALCVIDKEETKVNKYSIRRKIQKLTKKEIK